jgi:hypothetical protein
MRKQKKVRRLGSYQPVPPTRKDSPKPSLAREHLRRRFQPERVKILFVGEAPPASGRFFYQADSGLYRAIRETFIQAFPNLRHRPFLESFRSLGCYLVDLCGKPVDRMEARSRRLFCAAGEVRLSNRIRQLDPEIVVIVVRSIGNVVRRAELRAGWSGLHVEVPYPGRWHHYRKEFRQKLVPLLRTHLVISGHGAQGDRDPSALRQQLTSPKPLSLRQSRVAATCGPHLCSCADARSSSKKTRS